MEQKTATVRSTAVEQWLADLERDGWTIHGYTSTSQSSGTVRVTATVARPGRPPATPPLAPSIEPVDGGLW